MNKLNMNKINMYKMFFFHMLPQIILNFLITLSEKLCNNIVGIVGMIFISYFMARLRWMVLLMVYCNLNGLKILKQITRFNRAYHTKMGIYMVCGIHIFSLFLVLSVCNELGEIF